MLNASAVERWLGAEQVSNILEASRSLTIPVPVARCPGRLFAHRGDFIGSMTPHHYGLVDRDLSRVDGQYRAYGRRYGFASLNDLISEATTGGKRQDWRFERVGTAANAAGNHMTLWYVGGTPIAGAVPAALPGGTARSRTDVGAIGPQTNAAGGDTLHLVTAWSLPTVGLNTLLLYDRLWDGLIAASSSGAQTISGTPTRYATTTSPGNFGIIEQGTVLASTAHNWSIEYTDDAGNTAQSTPTLTGAAAGAANRLDHTQLTIPLASGDTGVRAFTKITNSSAAITGSAVIVLGHPLAFIPQPVANNTTILDAVNSAFNLTQIQDSACLALLEVSKGATTATSYYGHLVMVSG